jgi:hypothetical protein
MLPTILFSILSRPHLHAFTITTIHYLLEASVAQIVTFSDVKQAFTDASSHDAFSPLSPTAVLQVVFKDPTTNYLADMTPR